jgi:hypothetical protein
MRCAGKLKFVENLDVGPRIAEVFRSSFSLTPAGSAGDDFD